MLFAFSVPAQIISFFQFKEVIGAVVIKDIFSAFYNLLAVFVKLGLYKIVLFRKNRKRPVDVMELKGRLFDEFGSLSVGRMF